MTDKEGSLKEISDKLENINETLKKAFLKETEKNGEGKAETPVDVLSALLDFYADRASSFASLFVASIFGLVTLSAIIQNYAKGNFWWYMIGGIPYILFVVSGYFT